MLATVKKFHEWTTEHGHWCTRACSLAKQALSDQGMGCIGWRWQASASFSVLVVYDSHSTKLGSPGRLKEWRTCTFKQRRPLIVRGSVHACARAAVLITVRRRRRRSGAHLAVARLPHGDAACTRKTQSHRVQPSSFLWERVKPLACLKCCPSAPDLAILSKHDTRPPLLDSKRCAW